MGNKDLQPVEPMMEDYTTIRKDKNGTVVAHSESNEVYYLR